MSAVTTSKEVVVQLDPPQSQSRLLSMNKLLQAFRHDPDLASLQQILLPNILPYAQDVTTYPISLVRVNLYFPTSFFQHANFVNGQQN